MNVDHTTPPADGASYSFAQRLEHWISSGVWPTGTTLPSVPELGRIFKDQDMASIQEVLDGFLSQGVLLHDAESGRLSARDRGSSPGSDQGHADLDQPFVSVADRAHALGEARNALLCQCVRRLASQATQEDLVVPEQQQQLVRPSTSSSESARLLLSLLPSSRPQWSTLRALEHTAAC